MEIWKTIDGFENYNISNYGNVKSLERITKNGINSTRITKERLLRNHISKTGYYVISLRNNSKRKTFKIHRLIAIYFIHNEYNKEYVNHINGIKLDNSIDNLEWVTIKENNHHAKITGLVNNDGVNNTRAKLTKKDVIFIRNSNLKLKELSLMFGVNQSGISKVKLGKTYKNA